MTHETSPAGSRYETTHVFATGPDGRPVVASGKWPKPEFYADEITRLTEAALSSCPVQELGYLDALGAVVNFREKKVGPGGIVGPFTHYIGEYRDANSDELLQVRYVAMQPVTTGLLGRRVQPTEIKWYLPQTDELKIVRLDDLSLDDMDDEARLAEIIETEQTLATITQTKKDRFFLYTGLVMAAGERMPK